jgi:hypothetical protein
MGKREYRERLKKIEEGDALDEMLLMSPSRITPREILRKILLV